MELWRQLGREEVVAFAAFSSGFFSAVPLRLSTLKAPLSAMFGGALAGIFSVLGASFVAMLLPSFLHPAVSVVCFAASGYSIARGMVR